MTSKKEGHLKYHPNWPCLPCIYEEWEDNEKQFSSETSK